MESTTSRERNNSLGTVSSRSSCFSTSTRSVKPSTWDVEEVAEWAIEVGFPELAQVFREHEVSGDVLLRHVTLKELKEEFNVFKFGVRSRVMDAIAALRKDDDINEQCVIESFVLENDYTPPIPSCRTPPQASIPIPPKHNSLPGRTKAPPTSQRSKTTAIRTNKHPQKTLRLAQFGRPLDEIFFGHYDEENLEGEEDLVDELDEEDSFYFYRDKCRTTRDFAICKSDVFDDQQVDLRLANAVQRLMRANFRRPPVLPLSNDSESYRAAYAPNLLTHKKLNGNVRCLVVEATDDDEVTVDFLPYSDIEQYIRELPPTPAPPSTTKTSTPASSTSKNFSKPHLLSLDNSKFHADICNIDEQCEMSDDRAHAANAYGYGRGLGKGYLRGCDDDDEDAILPAYGESDSEVDEQVEKEIEREEVELRKKEEESRRRKEHRESQRFSGEQVVEFLENFITEQMLIWEAVQLPRLESKRYIIYQRLRRKQKTTEGMRSAIKHLEKERIFSLRRELEQGSYTNEIECRRCAGVLTPTVFQRENYKWKIALMEGEKPQTPPETPTRKKKKNKKKKKKKKKAQSDDGMSEFIDDDEIEEESTDVPSSSSNRDDEVADANAGEAYIAGSGLSMEVGREQGEDEGKETDDEDRETEEMAQDHQQHSEPDEPDEDAAMVSSEVVADVEMGEMDGEIIGEIASNTLSAAEIVDDAENEMHHSQVNQSTATVRRSKEREDPPLGETVLAEVDLSASVKESAKNSSERVVIEDDIYAESRTLENSARSTELQSAKVIGRTPEEPTVDSNSLRPNRDIPQQTTGEPSYSSSFKGSVNAKPNVEASVSMPTPSPRIYTAHSGTPPPWKVRRSNPVVMIRSRGGNRDEPITLESSDDERATGAKATGDTETVSVLSNSNEPTDSARHATLRIHAQAADVARVSNGPTDLRGERPVREASCPAVRPRSPSEDDGRTSNTLDMAGQAVPDALTKVHEYAKMAVRLLNMGNAQALFSAMKKASSALSLQDEAQRTENFDRFLAIGGSCREFDCVVELLHKDKSLAAEYYNEVHRIHAMPPGSLDRFVEWHRYCGDPNRPIVCPLSQPLDYFNRPSPETNPVKKRRRHNQSPDDTDSDAETSGEEEDVDVENGSDTPEVVFISGNNSTKKNRQSKKSKLMQENVLKSRVLKKVQDQSQKQERAWRRRAESHRKQAAIQGNSFGTNPTADNRPARVVINIGHSSREEDILVPFELSGSLKPHQIEGIQFMWKNIVTFGNNGAILAHAMGLGKTFQVITLVATLLKEIRLKNTAIPEHLHGGHIMILCPATIIDNWIDEFEKWIPSNSELRRQVGRVTSISSKMNPDQKLLELRAWYRLRGTLVTSYSSFRSLGQAALVSEIDGGAVELRKYLLDPGPSLVIADEGHTIKNPKAAISTVIKRITTPSRICLTGYPLQNNLEEYWCMVDWVYPHYLGDQNWFKHMYSKPIDGGLWPESSRSDRTLAKRKLHVLNKMIQQFVQRYDATVLRNSLPQKLEFVISCRLTDMQTKLYNTFLDNAANMLEHDNFLERGNILQLICNHPAVLMVKDEDDRKFQSNSAKEYTLSSTPGRNPHISLSATADLADMGNENRPIVISEEDEDVIEEKETRMEKENTQSLLNSESVRSLLEACPNLTSVEHSCKVEITLTILKACKESGEKVLLFSKSIPTLNFLEKTLHEHGYPTFRLDGGTSIPTRQSLINNFNANQNHQIFLISISTGGVGVNLVSANRVILFDIGWNPSNAEQAIARAFRFGQKRRVFVYRLQTYDTWEHQLFKANVHKVGLAMRVVDRTQVKRHFNKTEIKSYFKRPDENAICQFADDYVTEDAVTNAVIARHREQVVSIIGHESFLSFVDEEFDAEDRRAVVELLEAERERLTGKRRQQVAASEV